MHTMVLSFITASKSSLAQTDLFYALNEHLSNESLGGICSCNAARHNSQELIQLIVASPPEFLRDRVRTCAQICSKFSIKCQRFQLYPKINFLSRLSRSQQTRLKSAEIDKATCEPSSGCINKCLFS